MTAIFLSLHGTRVARDETSLFKWGTQIGAGPYEGTGDPVTNCACLTRDAPTLNVNVDIKIPRGELFPEDILTNAQYVENGRVTPEGLQQLENRMPFADLSAFRDNPLVQDFGNLLTVKDMCRYVEGKIGAT